MTEFEVLKLTVIDTSFFLRMRRMKSIVFLAASFVAPVPNFLAFQYGGLSQSLELCCLRGVLLKLTNNSF